MVDIAHIAGLVATGVHQPGANGGFCYDHHTKTLRGPRGRHDHVQEQYAKQIDKAIFPGTTGAAR